MYRFIRLATLILGLSLVPAGISQAQSLDPAPIIETLGLATASTPMSEKTGWSPKNIVVHMMPGMQKEQETYVKAFEAAAGDANVIFAGGHNFRYSKSSMEQLGRRNRHVQGGHTQDRQPEPALDTQLQRRHGLLYWRATRSSWQVLHLPTTSVSPARPLQSTAWRCYWPWPEIFPSTCARSRTTRGNADQPDARTFGELTEKTMLVAGLGGIGTEVARRAHGLGMRIVATRNSSRTGPDFVDYVGLSDELHKLAADADVVVNALPLTGGTTGLFDKSFFDAVQTRRDLH